MSRTSKQTLTGKKRKENSSAVGANKQAADAVRAKLQTLVAGNIKHSVGCWDVVEKMLRSGGISMNNVLLGNGFNMAIGVRTGYSQLRDAFLKHGTVKEFLEEEKPALLAEMEEEFHKIEILISENLKGHSCQRFLKEIFYGKILQQCSGGYDSEKL